MQTCGKNFSNIKKDFLPWKSVRSIIEYYYRTLEKRGHAKQRKRKLPKLANKKPNKSNKSPKLDEDKNDKSSSNSDSGSSDTNVSDDNLQSTDIGCNKNTSDFMSDEDESSPKKCPKKKSNANSNENHLGESDSLVNTNGLTDSKKDQNHTSTSPQAKTVNGNSSNASAAAAGEPALFQYFRE